MDVTSASGWRECRISAAGVGLVVYERGPTDRTARTLVLIHGLGHWTQAAWDALVPFLDPALRIVAFDLPGFGRSEKPDARYDTRFFGSIVAAVLDQVTSGAVGLCGHSLGGYIAAHYAAAYPQRVARLILIAPAGFVRAARFIYAVLGSQIARWLFMRRPTRAFVNRTLNSSVFDPASILPAIRETAFELAEQSDVRRAFAGVYTGAIQDFRQAPAVHARLRGYAGPALLIWGRRDRFIPLRGLEPARRVYPQASVLICERSGHLPMVEEPQTVAAAIMRFIS